MPLVGFPLDTTLAAASLVFSGVVDRFPRIRWVLGHLGGADIAETEMPDQSLPLKLGERRELFRDRSVGRAMHAADPQIDDIEHVDAEIAKVVVDTTLDLFRFERRYP